MGPGDGVTRVRQFIQEVATILQPTPASSKFVTYYELLDAFGKPGCPVCTNLERGSLKALSDLLYEQVTDPASRRRLVESRGYCNWHAWMLPKVQNSPLGAALIYRHLLGEALERLKASRRTIQGESFWRGLWERLTRTRTGPISLLDWWRQKSRCPLCALARQTERESLRTILRFIGEAEFAIGFARSAGLCLAHLCETAAIGKDHPNLPVLLSVHEKQWSALAEELEEFARKCDYRFATEAMGQEGSSWCRVVDVFVGRPGVFGPERGGRAMGGCPVLLGRSEESKDPA
jgi:hypothetical protein